MNNQNPLNTNVFDVITLGPANPAAGANFTLSVNANSRWRIIGLDFTVQTDGTAANRIVEVHGFDGTDIIQVTRSLNLHTASLTIDYNANTGTGQAHEGGSIIDIQMPLNNDLYLNIGDSIRITVINIQTGDQISDIRVRVQQWITEN